MWIAISFKDKVTFTLIEYIVLSPQAIKQILRKSEASVMSIILVNNVANIYSG